MNLLHYIDSIEAGGPGSGCHGENCGRPEGANDGTGAKAQQRNSRTIKDLSITERAQLLKERTQQGVKPSTSKDTKVNPREVVEKKDWKQRAVNPKLAPKEGKAITGPKGLPAVERTAHHAGEFLISKTIANEELRNYETHQRGKQDLELLQRQAVPKAPPPKYNVNDQVRVNIPVKVWSQERLSYKTKNGMIAEVAKVIPGVAGNPNMLEVYPFKKGFHQDLDKSDAIHLREDEVSLHKSYTPEKGEHGFIDESKYRRGSVQQQVILPGGGKATTLKPRGDDRPVSSLARLKVPLENQTTRTWPEQAIWDSKGQPKVETSPLYGKFKYNTLKQTSEGKTPKSGIAVYDARYNKTEKAGGATLFVTRDKSTNDYQVKEIKTDENQKTAYTKRVAFGTRPVVTTVKFKSSGAQQIYMQRRYGIDLSRRAFRK